MTTGVHPRSWQDALREPTPVVGRVKCVEFEFEYDRVVFVDPLNFFGLLLGAQELGRRWREHYLSPEEGVREHTWRRR